ncbi:hypothetical protein ACJIZ3_025541 [Penstemon smallii]|uniref:Uncharacterized protein n=1 Tax=Penstemon smallii TaxID=265156 RepID=A0ABD3TV86_9LAMI
MFETLGTMYVEIGSKKKKFQFSEFGRMGFSSRKWARIISLIASRMYFYIIIAQVPLFSFPCRIGMCKTPIEVMACQMIASENIPQVAVKALLYPGAIRKAFSQDTTIPSHNQLLHSFKSNMRKTSAITDLKHLEVLVGSYLCVFGALLGLIKPGRMSLIGLGLIVWGILREVFMGNNTSYSGKALNNYSDMMFALVLAILSVRRDVRKLIKCCKPRRVAKRLKNCSKAKFN